MTTINTQDDFLKALDDNPQWRDAVRAKLLGEDLLGLPAKFYAFVEQMSVFAAEQLRFNAQIRQDIEELKAQVNEQGARLSRVEGHVGNIRGSDYERKIGRRARSIARRSLNIRNSTVIHSTRDRDGEELSDLSEQAEENGLITADEANELERADLILTGTSAEGNEIYLLAEASVTISHQDIERAHTRAAILGKAVGNLVQPAVAGAEISDENRQKAQQDGVTVIIEPE